MWKKASCTLQSQADAIPGNACVPRPGLTCPLCSAAHSVHSLLPCPPVGLPFKDPFLPVPRIQPREYIWSNLPRSQASPFFIWGCRMPRGYVLVTGILLEKEVMGVRGAWFCPIQIPFLCLLNLLGLNPK